MVSDNSVFLKTFIFSYKGLPKSINQIIKRRVCSPKQFWKVKCESLSHVRLFVTPWTVAHQAPLSTEFSRQEYWSGLTFPSPGDLPKPGIKHGSPALQADFSHWAIREAPVIWKFGEGYGGCAGPNTVSEWFRPFQAIYAAGFAFLGLFSWLRW